MVIKMIKNKKMKKKIDKSIIVIIVAVVIVLITIVMRVLSYSQTWLVCEKDLNNEYHEILKFRYDADNNLYGYYRFEQLHNMSDETIEQNYQYFLQEIDKVKDSISDGFKYEVYKTDSGLEVKTYIGVSIYPSFFDSYINNEVVKSTAKLDDIKNHYEANEYSCKVSRK